MKVCTKCHTARPLEEYNRSAKSNDGYGWHCRSCSREYARKRRQEPEFRDRKRHNSLVFQYGIGLEEYQAMLEKQAGLCAICNNPETKLHSTSKAVMPLSVDHCHETNRVRGLLCSQCNFMIGLANDDISRLQQAIEYLSDGGDI